MLDVAAGNGMMSLAAARRWCDVTSTDYVPALLDRGRARASAEGMTIAFEEAETGRRVTFAQFNSRAERGAAALERMGAFAQGGRGGPKDSDAAKAYYERAAALGDEDAKKALERLRCPYAIKDKRGNVVTNLCF